VTSFQRADNSTYNSKQSHAQITTLHWCNK